MSETLYQLLGVAEDATTKEIQRAYRRRALRYRLDITEGGTTRERVPLEKQYHVLTEAYAVLSSPTLRTLYDECQLAGIDFEEARAAAERENQVDFDRIQRAIVRAVRGAVPQIARGVEWHPPEADPAPFDMLVAGLQEGAYLKVHLQVVPVLSSRTLPAFLANAEAVVKAASGVTTMRHDYAFLVVGQTSREVGQVFEAIEDFNQLHWTQRPEGPVRAFVACSGLHEGTVFVPGVGDPYPDLTRLRLVTRSPGERASEAAPSLPPRASTGTQPPPLAEPDPLDPDGQEASPLAPELSHASPVHVLVVDDEALPREVVRDALEGGPFVLHEAADWNSFRNVLLAEPIGVLVLDVNLPGLGGEKLALFAKNLFVPCPKIVLHSGMEERELRRLARAVGALNHVCKGDDPTRLRNVVEAAARAYLAAS